MFTELPNNETPVVTLQRRAEEQFGLSLIDLECIGFSSAAEDVQSVDINGQNTHPHVFVFVSTYWQGDVQKNENGNALAFFNIRELPELRSPMQHYLDMFLQWLPERGFSFV
jgi:ADP-ribose pyrophosphatase YjhB (NUDIX family)